MDVDMSSMEMEEMVRREIQKYSVVVGIVLVIVFVVPCITLALVAKCFQKQTAGGRKSSTSFGRSMSTVNKMADEDRSSDNYLQDSESSGYGVFGIIEWPLSKLECIERIVSLKHQLTCIEAWKAYAPPPLFAGGPDCKKLVAVLKPAPTASGSINNKENHANCVKAEVNYMSRVSTHHFILNLLGACSPSSNSANISALLMEYPLYGSLHSFLVCKRLGRISNNSKMWAGLGYQDQEDNVLRALPDESRPFLSSLLDDMRVRERPFKTPLNEPLTSLDLLLFALQLVNGMQFLTDAGIPHKHLSSENIVISVGFYLKISCLSRDSSFALHKRGTVSGQSRRTPTGRNMVKWDSPECIEGREYTEKSNVWRFGMILWEISSLGDTPFAEVPGKLLVEHMKKGALPHLPVGCSDQCYSIMRKCWQINSELRPSFEDLTRVILSQLQASQHNATEVTEITDESTSKSAVMRYQKRRPSLLTQQRHPSLVKMNSSAGSPATPGPVSSSSTLPSCSSDTALLALPETPSSPVVPPCPENYDETEV